MVFAFKYRRKFHHTDQTQQITEIGNQQIITGTCIERERTAKRARIISRLTGYLGARDGKSFRPVNERKITFIRKGSIGQSLYLADRDTNEFFHHLQGNNRQTTRIFQMHHMVSRFVPRDFFSVRHDATKFSGKFGVRSK